MALSERDILGNVGALVEACNTLISMPEKPPADDDGQHAKTVENMKDTIRKCGELLVGGMINDVNRIANALEELVRLKQEEAKNEYAGK
jgi:hypothetical protein